MWNRCFSFSLSPIFPKNFPWTPPPESVKLRQVKSFWQDGWGFFFPPGTVQETICQLEWTLCPQKERQIKRVSNLFRFFFSPPLTFRAEERIWLVQLASIMSWMEINTPLSLVECACSGYNYLIKHTHFCSGSCGAEHTICVSDTIKYPY